MREQDGETRQCTNYLTIMHEVAKSVYLLDVLFGKKDSKDRAEIENFIELANRTEVADLVTHLNKHLEMKMFLVGMNITAADVVAHLRVASHFKNMKDSEKKDVPHAFRWVDHIQHLPGMLELVQGLGLFVSFPSEKEEVLSKAQLKKLAKEQYKKDQKAGGPPAGKEAGKEEAKKGGDKEKKQPNKEEAKNPEGGEQKPQKK